MLLYNYIRIANNLKERMFLCYARVSTNNPEQIVSLNNQIEQLNKYIITNKLQTNVVSEIKSISNGISDVVKEEVEKYGKTHVVVTSMDRLTRDLGDIRFIKENISGITVLNDNKTYTPTIDWKQIVGMNVSSTEEIEKIKYRRVSGSKKRKISDASDYYYSAKKRCNSINNLLITPKNQKVLKDIAEFMQKSQHMTSKNDWTSVSKIYEKYTKVSLFSIYRNLKYDDIDYRLSRTDVTACVKQMLSSTGIMLDNSIAKEFINANVCLGRRSNQEITEENVVNLTDNLKQLLYGKKNLLTDNEFKQMDAILNKLEGDMEVDNESEEKVKPKAKKTGKKVNKCVESDSESEMEVVKPKKASKKVYIESDSENESEMEVKVKPKKGKKN